MAEAPTPLSKKELKEKEKERVKKLTEFLGTSKVIKLPYIIGSDEYRKHPFAGTVYLGEAGADE